MMRPQTIKKVRFVSHKIKKSAFSLLLGEMSGVRQVGGRTERSGGNVSVRLVGGRQRGLFRARISLHQTTFVAQLPKGGTTEGNPRLLAQCQ